MTITVVSEENHGPIIYAKDDDAAKCALLETQWVDRWSEMWCTDSSPNEGEYRSLEDMYGDDWKNRYMAFNRAELELMGYNFWTEELYE